MQYRVKLFGPPLGSHTVREFLGHILFDADADPLALAEVKGRYARAISRADYAMLLDGDGEFIWETPVKPDALPT